MQLKAINLLFLLLMICRAKVKLGGKLGVHARPAADIVEVTNKFNCDIIFLFPQWAMDLEGKKISSKKDNITIDAKSIMAVLQVAIESGTAFDIECDGDDAEVAIKALESLFKWEKQIDDEYESKWFRGSQFEIIN
ncbi:HPr family phosphocarrier protein [Fibrobacterota bacterium]